MTTQATRTSCSPNNADSSSQKISDVIDEESAQGHIADVNMNEESVSSQLLDSAKLQITEYPLEQKNERLSTHGTETRKADSRQEIFYGVFSFRHRSVRSPPLGPPPGYSSSATCDLVLPQATHGASSTSHSPARLTQSRDEAYAVACSIVGAQRRQTELQAMRNRSEEEQLELERIGAYFYRIREMMETRRQARRPFFRRIALFVVKPFACLRGEMEDEVVEEREERGGLRGREIDESRFEEVQGERLVIDTSPIDNGYEKKETEEVVDRLVDVMESMRVVEHQRTVTVETVALVRQPPRKKQKKDPPGSSRPPNDDAPSSSSTLTVAEEQLRKAPRGEPRGDNEEANEEEEMGEESTNQPDGSADEEEEPEKIEQAKKKDLGEMEQERRENEVKEKELEREARERERMEKEEEEKEELEIQARAKEREKKMEEKKKEMEKREEAERRKKEEEERKEVEMRVEADRRKKNKEERKELEREARERERMEKEEEEKEELEIQERAKEREKKKEEKRTELEKREEAERRKKEEEKKKKLLTAPIDTVAVQSITGAAVDGQAGSDETEALHAVDSAGGQATTHSVIHESGESEQMQMDDVPMDEVAPREHEEGQGEVEVMEVEEEERPIEESEEGQDAPTRTPPRGHGEAAQRSADGQTVPLPTPATAPRSLVRKQVRFDIPSEPSTGAERRRRRKVRNDEATATHPPADDDDNWSTAAEAAGPASRYRDAASLAARIAPFPLVDGADLERVCAAMRGRCANHRAIARRLSALQRRAAYVEQRVSARIEREPSESEFPHAKSTRGLGLALLKCGYKPADDLVMSKFLPELCRLEQLARTGARVPLERLARRALASGIYVGHFTSDRDRYEAMLRALRTRFPTDVVEGLGGMQLKDFRALAKKDPLNRRITPAAMPADIADLYVAFTHDYRLFADARIIVDAARVFWRDAYARPDDAPLAHQARKIWFAFLMASGRTSARFMPVLSQRQLVLVFALLRYFPKEKTVSAAPLPSPATLEYLEKAIERMRSCSVPPNALPAPLDALRRLCTVARVRAAALWTLDGDRFLMTLVSFARELPQATIKSWPEEVAAGCELVTRSMLTRDARRQGQPIQPESLEDMTEEEAEEARAKEAVLRRIRGMTERELLEQLIDERITHSQKADITNDVNELVEHLEEIAAERAPIPSDFDWDVHQIVQLDAEFAQRWLNDRSSERPDSDWWMTEAGEALQDHWDMNSGCDSNLSSTELSKLNPSAGLRRRRASCGEVELAGGLRQDEQASTALPLPDWKVCAPLPDTPLLKGSRHPLWIARAEENSRRRVYIPLPVVDVWDSKLLKFDDTGFRTINVKKWKIHKATDSCAELRRQTWHSDRMDALLRRATRADDNGRLVFIDNPTSAEEERAVPAPDFGWVNGGPFFRDWRATRPQLVDPNPADEARYQERARSTQLVHYPSERPMRQREGETSTSLDRRRSEVLKFERDRKRGRLANVEEAQRRVLELIDDEPEEEMRSSDDNGSTVVDGRWLVFHIFYISLSFDCT